MSREKFPWIYDGLDARRRGDAPKFDPPIHHCPICDRDWLCSDRFTQPECGPLKFYPDSKDHACSPCLGGDVYDEEDRTAWWETNSVVADSNQ